MEKKHLVVVSVDALVYEDLEYAKTLPMFGMLLNEGARIEKVQTIYPSLTHPAHASIMSGCTSGKTGIISNEVFKVDEPDRPWFNYLSEVKCDTIFHAAKRAGLKTAVCRWPVTAKGNDVIDYLIPDIFNETVKKHRDNPADAYREMGTCDEIIDIVEEAIKRYGATDQHPAYDDFEIYCAGEIIRRYKPDILFTNPGYVDNMRHRTGLFTTYVKQAVKRTDEWLGELWKALCDAGIEKNTDFVIVSDHGHINIKRIMCPNVFLVDAGLIRLDENGRVKDWDAYMISGALSLQVYLSRPDDKELYNRVFNMLKDMAEEKIYGFEKIFTTDEVKKRYGLYGDFSFVLETDGYTSFNESCNRPVVREIETKDYRYGNSTHGHLPEKGPQPVFLGMGPSFKKGVVIPCGHIINHAPTFAEIMGLELFDAEGKAVKELLK